MVRKSEKFRLSVNGCRCADVGIDSTTARCHAVFSLTRRTREEPNEKNSRGKKRNDGRITTAGKQCRSDDDRGRRREKQKREFNDGFDKGVADNSAHPESSGRKRADTFCERDFKNRNENKRANSKKQENWAKATRSHFRISCYGRRIDAAVERSSIPAACFVAVCCCCCILRFAALIT
jgi:hypothetical protein